MSAETKIMTSVSTVISFIKERVRIDMQHAAQKGLINMTHDELERTCNVIESSIEASFSRSMNEVVSAARNLKG